MKSLEIKTSVIQPQNLKNDPNIRAWFTLKNKEFGQAGQVVPGLNLGFNTPEKKEIVAQNRLQLLSDLKINPDWVAFADQVHSNRVQMVTEGGIYPSTDGLITQIPGLAIGIQVADCAAVLLWDSKNKVIGALHAGWRGAAGDIIPKGIEKMQEIGAQAENLKAYVSPCLSLKNFEVGEEVADQFPEEFVDYDHFAKPHVDLKRFLQYQLTEAGLAEANLEISDQCTIENAQDFYSYRREGDGSGRMMAIIQISD